MINLVITDLNNKKFEIKEELGQGGFGKVYIGYDREEKPYAIKFIGPINDKQTSESFKREIQLATKVQHDNLLRFIGQGECIYNKKKYFFTISEYCSGGNYRTVLQKRPFSLEVVLLEFQQILLGLEELHKHIIHRDIKPENILIAGNNLKVADLGLSKSINETTKTHTVRTPPPKAVA